MKILFIVFFLLIYFPTFLRAQEDKHTGVIFEHSFNWKKILEQAKSENKYIFVDCFTTWCGPCKLMDKEVYTKEIVGNYFNQNFIAVKLQMDKTNTDNQQVIDWYTDAEMFQKKYGIPVYPTYLF